MLNRAFEQIMCSTFNISTRGKQIRFPVSHAEELLEQADVVHIDLEDDIGDGIKHELYVVCVRGARQVHVHLLGVAVGVRAPVEGLELDLYVGGRVLVRVGT